jgi:hypothetical protein
VELIGASIVSANPETAAASNVLPSGNTYAVTLSKAASGYAASVVVTAVLLDVNGSQVSTTVTAASGGTVIGYGSTATDTTGTNESYPIPTQMPSAKVSIGAYSIVASGGCSCGQAKISCSAAGLIAPYGGTEIVEFQIPFANNTEGVQAAGPSLPMQNDMIYAQLIVTVVA